MAALGIPADSGRGTRKYAGITHAFMNLAKVAMATTGAPGMRSDSLKMIKA
jgi:hypothetical protein